ncbi:Rec8 like domain-containing protein [Trichoderma austrokoningii]
MFYSHEILNSAQYGVATIWLVATVGKGTQKRLTKKAIQEVNVPKACEKILDPGAPLALRLQGNLLYGVSRVFEQQCAYVLTDAEKTQSDMVTFFRIIQTSETDPRAGKTKRQNIVLQDDPAFDPFASLPNLNLLQWDKDLLLFPSQGGSSKFSQMTPLTAAGSQGSSSPRHRSALINLELPPSSQSAASCRLPSDFGRLSPLFNKSIHHSDSMVELQQPGDDEFPSISGIGFEFDAEGYLVSMLDQDLGPEPELPPLPAPTPVTSRLGLQRVMKDDDQVLILGEEENLLDFGDQPLQGMNISTQPQGSERAAADANQVSARMTRSRRVIPNAMLDEIIALPKRQPRVWAENYIAYTESLRQQQRKTTTTLGQARKNAATLLYEYGVASVGVYHQEEGLFHPLAADFSGAAFKARIRGKEPEAIEHGEPAKRGRRRKSDEAFEGEHDGDERNTKQRVVEEVELGRGGNHDETHVMFDDNSIPEIGMDAAPPMDDRHSSSMMPWSRAGSAVPGSSVRGSAQKPKTAPSPLLGRGSALNSIDRHSDPAEPLFGMDDFGSHDSSFQLGGPVGPLDYDRDNATQGSTQGLDVTSQDFLGYVAEQAAKTGVTYNRDKKRRRWIEFKELAEPFNHPRAVAAQAFLHVLSLASKNVISVHQEGAKAMQPFGTIRIGIKTSANEKFETQVESEDELA